jgi:hypothetical protein
MSMKPYGRSPSRRLKIHDDVLEGIDLALRLPGYQSIESLVPGKKR